ncbi:MAG: glycosidase [Leadbetterella sp.]|jgi:4-O-beta-D-mannosyl-D-glucose phosphorylase|nr:glycosidase [Leadbetterella sp.]
MDFKEKIQHLKNQKEEFLKRENLPLRSGNGIYEKFKYPILTKDHVPVEWEYDLNPHTNPFLMKRNIINATFNAGAIKFQNKFLLCVRVEGADRKSFFAMAESPNGVDNFRFWEYPVTMPETEIPDGNVYDMRLVEHEDGWIYGLFCTERKDPNAKPGDESSAIAQCGIARTRNFIEWERLPDLKTPSPQQRNAVLHPEFVNGKYAFYTRPQDGFIEAGTGGGIGFGFCDSMSQAIIDKEYILDEKKYHTVYEVKNGQGPAPIKTSEGWLHLAHGVRNTAAGLRYVLYMFITDLQDLTKVIYKPAGYFLAPEGDESIGDVSNVAFCNGWVLDNDGKIFIYYASSDTRMHVATTTVEKLLDYCKNTVPDGYRSATSVETLKQLIATNKKLS